MQNLELSAAVTVHPSATSRVRFAGFIFDRDNHILSLDGDEIALPPRVLLLLDMLIERAGTVVSKNTLMDGVWKDACVNETSLTEAVSLLRQALGDDAQHPSYIQTVHRRGYRFLAQIAAVGKIEGASPQPAEDTASTTPRNPRAQARRSLVLLWISLVLALLAVATLVIVTITKNSVVEETTRPALRLVVNPPDGVVVPFYAASCLALSPDGNVLVFAGRDTSGKYRLYRRHISDFESHAIAGTEKAISPFFSPDGRWIAFFAEGELRKTPIDGGVVTRICPAAFVFGGSWSEDGTIVFTGSYSSGLSLVSAEGGEVIPLTNCRSAEGEIGHWWPQVLPGGKAVLFTIWSANLERARIAVLDLETGVASVLIENASFARFLPPASLLYVTPGGIVSVPFDIAANKVNGPAEKAIDQALVNPFVGGAHFAVAGNGTLAYLPAAQDNNELDLVMIDNSNNEVVLDLNPRLYRNLRVNQQNNAVAVTIVEDSRSDVWTTSITEPALNRVTFSGFNIEPRWSPDGAWIFFASNRDGPFNIYRKPTNGHKAAERIVVSDLHQYPQAFTPDGKNLLYIQATAETGFDIWIMPLADGDGAARPLIQTPANEYLPSISPNGAWISYLCDESGTWEVYVRSFADDGGLWQISEGGAGEAFWSANGRKLYYVQDGKIVACDVTTSPVFTLDATQHLPLREQLLAIDSLANDKFIAVKKRHEWPRIDAVRIVVANTR